MCHIFPWLVWLVAILWAVQISSSSDWAVRFLRITLSHVPCWNKILYPNSPRVKILSWHSNFQMRLICAQFVCKILQSGTENPIHGKVAETFKVYLREWEATIQLWIHWTVLLFRHLTAAQSITTQFDDIKLKFNWGLGILLLLLDRYNCLWSIWLEMFEWEATAINSSTMTLVCFGSESLKCGESGESLIVG